MTGATLPPIADDPFAFDAEGARERRGARLASMDAHIAANARAGLYMPPPAGLTPDQLADWKRFARSERSDERACLDSRSKSDTLGYAVTERFRRVAGAGGETSALGGARSASADRAPDFAGTFVDGVGWRPRSRVERRGESFGDPPERSRPHVVASVYQDGAIEAAVRIPNSVSPVPPVNAGPRYVAGVSGRGVRLIRRAVAALLDDQPSRHRSTYMWTLTARWRPHTPRTCGGTDSSIERRVAVLDVPGLLMAGAGVRARRRGLRITAAPEPEPGALLRPALDLDELRRSRVARLRAQRDARLRRRWAGQDREIKAAFIRWLKLARKWAPKSFRYYVAAWDLQARGVLHVHVLLFARVPRDVFDRLRLAWAEDYGMGPGAVDATAITKARGAADYMARYITREHDDDGARVGRNGRPYVRSRWRGNAYSMSAPLRAYTTAVVSYAWLASSPEAKAVRASLRYRGRYAARESFGSWRDAFDRLLALVESATRPPPGGFVDRLDAYGAWAHAFASLDHRDGDAPSPERSPGVDAIEADERAALEALEQLVAIEERGAIDLAFAEAADPEITWMHDPAAVLPVDAGAAVAAGRA